MKATGKPGAAFLGHAMGQTSSPATVTVRLRSQVGGMAKIDSLPNGAAKPDVVVSVPFEVKAGEWQEAKVELTHSAPLGTLRVYLPDSEVDHIEVKPAKGNAQRWDF
jgi:hypothetical protein